MVLRAPAYHRGPGTAPRPPARPGPAPALAAGAVIENNGGEDRFDNEPKPAAPGIGARAGRGIR
ncbi:hypothetical protein ACWEQP_20140 [Streptomyces sp. NPDC004044]